MNNIRDFDREITAWTEVYRKIEIRDNPVYKEFGEWCRGSEGNESFNTSWADGHIDWVWVTGLSGIYEFCKFRRFWEI